MDQDRMFAGPSTRGLRSGPAEVADVAPAVGFAVGIDDLADKTRFRHAQPIVVAHHRRRVDHENDQLALPRFPARSRDHAVVRIVEIDPLKSFVGVVQIPERGFVSVNVIQMLHQPAQSVVARQIQSVPNRGCGRGSIRAIGQTRRP